jgi:hypothetical protein
VIGSASSSFAAAVKDERSQLPTELNNEQINFSGSAVFSVPNFLILKPYNRFIICIKLLLVAVSRGSIDMEQ